MHARKVHAYEVYAHEVHACEMHVYEAHTHEMHACEVHAHEVHAHEVYTCCVEAECHFYYLGDSSVYVHESCCPGDQRHLPTYVGPGRLPDGPPAKYGS